MARVAIKSTAGGKLSDVIGEYLEEIPLDVIDEMLTAEADIIEPMIEANAQTMLDGKYSEGITARSLTRKAPETYKGKNSSGQRQIALTFRGTRANGKKRKRNAEVAFINEYGSRKTAARPFIQKAIDTGSEKAFDEAEKVFDKWLENNVKK